MKNNAVPQRSNWAGPVGFTGGELKLAVGLAIIVLVGTGAVLQKRLLRPSPVVVFESHQIPTEQSGSSTFTIDHPSAGATKSPTFFGDTLNINAADYAELLILPGIGPVLATRIIAYREAHGPFSTVDGLLNVSGIGPKKLAQLRLLVCVR